MFSALIVFLCPFVVLIVPPFCSAVVEMPSDMMTPVAMAGLGTGIAPFRSLVQDRVARKRKGEAVGMHLAFLSFSPLSPFLFLLKS